MSYFRTLSMLACATVVTLTGCQSMSSTNQEGISHQAHTDVKQSAQARSEIDNSDLKSYTWHLVQATDNQNHAIEILNKIHKQVTMVFDSRPNGNAIGFNVGCNSMGGQYSLDSNVMQVNQIISTMMLCHDLDDAERQLAQSMSGSSQLSYKSGDQPILTQITTNGNTLVWQGTQTPEARYGQAGEIVYWEIDNKQQLCPDGSTKTCLRVRPVHYNNQGIKESVGDWDLFVGEIEGYTHDSSLERIVRLKRFVVDPVDVKGKQFVYVLDTVVESGTVE